MNTSQRKTRKWTAAEVEYLEEKVGMISIETIAKNLKRTPKSVTSKLAKIGISQMVNQSWLTASAFVEALNIDYAQLMHWVNKKGLPSRKPKFSKYRRIDINKFWKWAKDHTELIDWVRFEQLALGKEPKWAENVRKNTRVRKTKVKWTAHDDYILECMLKNEATYPEISEALQRSDLAIKRRIYQMQLPKPKRTSPLLYSDDEMAYIKKELEKRTPIPMIAKMLGRSERGLRGKLERDGITKEVLEK